eukprot:8055528-Alexandrium_andersonii.AAC.1
MCIRDSFAAAAAAHLFTSHLLPLALLRLPAPALPGPVALATGWRRAQAGPRPWRGVASRRVV